MRLNSICAATAWLVLCARSAQGQVKQLFENDTVRVSMATIKAGTTTPVHTHSLPHVTYVQSGGELRLHYADSTVRTMSLKTGDVYWGKVETHATQNVGPTDVVLITVDLKKPAQKKP